MLSGRTRLRDQLLPPYTGAAPIGEGSPCFALHNIPLEEAWFYRGHYAWVRSLLAKSRSSVLPKIAAESNSVCRNGVLEVA